MLHWLAGQRQPDSDDTGSHEPPETPAPIFAVRAFKHAIFGTPATTAHVRQRRNSNVDKELARPATRATRPVLTRPKSANDATMSARILDFPPSPTKGILLTPGTAGGRGKTVTFGDHIRDNGSRKNGQTTVEEVEPSRKLINPFDALEASEDRSVSPVRAGRRQGLTIQSTCCEDELRGDGLAQAAEKEPECATGRHWKHEYDIYRENTSKELRKLITKQKAAKSFAREKDDQCAALSEELRRERQTVQRLESRASELEAAMKELQAQLADRKRSDISHVDHYAAARTSPVSPLLTPLEQAVNQYTTNVDANQNGQISAVPGTRELPRRPLPRARHDSLDPEVPGIVSDRANTTRKPLYKSSVPKVDVSDIGTSLPYHAEEAKENLPPSHSLRTDDNNDPAGLPKSVVSREGEVIPPDRVAAARARLAARRQQRVAA